MRALRAVSRDTLRQSASIEAQNHVATSLKAKPSRDLKTGSRHPFQQARSNPTSALLVATPKPCRDTPQQLLLSRHEKSCCDLEPACPSPAMSRPQIDVVIWDFLQPAQPVSRHENLVATSPGCPATAPMSRPQKMMSRPQIRSAPTLPYRKLGPRIYVAHAAPR